MAWKNIQIFEVRGKGYFPVDMLRYDTCWPATESDSHKIAANMGDAGWSDFRAVTLKRYVENKKSRGPTQERWQSFGWSVLHDSVRTYG